MLSGQLNGQNGAPPPSSLQSALQMDPNQHLQLQQPGIPPPQQAMSPGPSAPKRRRKGDGGVDDGGGAAEPRRLRRSHEACARCRSKKIKCDSKHPRCTACTTAGTACNQEDRHRQRLTPRGHTIRMEVMLAQCEALIKHFVQDFEINRLEEFLVRHDIDPNAINSANISADFQIQETSARGFQQIDSVAPPTQQPSPKAYPMYPPPAILPPYPHMLHYHAGPYPPPMPMQGPPGLYSPFPPPGPYGAPPPAGPQQIPAPAAAQPLQSPTQIRIPIAKGTDPNGNDMSNTESLAKNFGVSPNIVGELKLAAATDKEDLAVGSNGLSSGRDRSFYETMKPRNPANWVALQIPRNGSVPSVLALSAASNPNSPTVTVWLPKDKNTLNHIVDVYFTRLNVHRPVFARKEFDKIIGDMYDQSTVVHDPGHICSVYLILALGTLSELNHRAVETDIDTGKPDSKAISNELMPPDWPEHDEFFERALSVKPDLRVTLSSLQALILLHWYLYTERQGRTLWRLVGSLVRLSIELGLHHDPFTQYVASPQGTHPPVVPLFTEEESQLRIRLWGIVLVHDRGTSILLGRPLAIAPSDTNTPRPCRPKANKRHDDFSEHFELSHPVAEIQADIINSLYTPKRQAGDTVMRNATRIIKSMVEFRRALPERYKHYFTGTKDWSLERKSELVQVITEDEGLTLLKLGIARILLLRALFSSKELSYSYRHQALVDAIITSHNIIVIHKQLIRFPDIAFFTSPIPLHIAAMVILYGHMSRCEVLQPQTALEDLAMALEMIPRFRWRWQRKDSAGGHPLIARLVERVMNVDLHSIGPSSHPVLFCEPDWDEEGAASPRSRSSQTTPTISSATYGSSGPVGYSPVTRALNGTAIMNGLGHNNSGPPPDRRLVDMPPGLFYPFYPEAQAPHEVMQGNDSSAPPNPEGGPHSTHDYSQLLAAAAAAQNSSYQPSHSTFMSEERTPPPHQSHGNVWMQSGQPRQAVNQHPPPQ